MSTITARERLEVEMGPRADPVAARPHPGALLSVPIVVQGIAFVPLVWLEGSAMGRTARVVLVIGITVAAALYERRAGRWGRGVIALLAGIVGTIAGAGIGPLYAAKVGISLMTIAGSVSLVTGLILLVAGTTLLIRAAHGWRRLFALPIGVALLLFVVYPMTIAVNATNRPATPLGASTPADRGLPYEDVTVRTADGVRLSAWYVPSTNGAALVLLHGAGSTRSDVLDHAVVLAGHGYGVLLLDARGHGESGGRAMDLGWSGDLDIAAATSYLAGRPDVEAGRIGAVGMSMGGEQAIAAAGSDVRIHAVVAEGVTGMQPADHGWLPTHVGGWIQRGIDQVLYGAAGFLSGAERPVSLQDAIRAAAPHPVLIIAGGDVPDESVAGRFFREASPETVELWMVAGAGHTEGLASHPAEWGAHVTEFLDLALAS